MAVTCCIRYIIFEVVPRPPRKHDHLRIATNGVMIGVYMLSVFFGSLISGRLGGLYEALSPAAFWTLHAGPVASGGVFLLLVGGRLSREIEAAAETGRLAVAV